MYWLWKAIITGAVSFAATNIDDIFVLMLFFGQVGRKGLRRRHIVVGQYLGFAALVAVSMVGYFARIVVPVEWIGLLGLLPIAIGIKKFFERGEAAGVHEPVPEKAAVAPVFTVAAVTFANGGDNIGIYTPLFAASDGAQLGVMLAVFFVLIAVWCVVGYYLGSHPAVGRALERYGHIVVPFVLISLGVYIMYESDTFRLILNGLGLSKG